MHYNIEEYVSETIIVILIVIILILCIIFFKKYKNVSWNKILNISSICFSSIALIVTVIRVEVHVENDTFVGIMAGFMGACATILVGVQIYNSIETSRKIKGLETLQNKINSDIEFLKEEKIKLEHYTNYKTFISLGVATSKERPVFALLRYFKALKEALVLNEASYINRALSNIEIVCKRIQNNNTFTHNNTFWILLFTEC